MPQSGKKLRKIWGWIGAALAFFISSGACATCNAKTGVLRVTLNHLEIGVDETTGSVVYLGSPWTGSLLEAGSESAGLVDVAYPVPAFAPLRLASRFSKARVEKEPDGVRITWDNLGPSRSNVALPGGQVSAVVTIRAADDSRSVIFTCRIVNHSSVPVRQELFPDLWGLRAFAGADGTRLRLARGETQPFLEPFNPPDGALFYAGRGWHIWGNPNGYYSENSLRWLDFGSYQGGLSLFQKEWGTVDPRGSANVPFSLITHRSEADQASLQLAWEQEYSIAPGESWDSGEFWLTPHPGGWAKGIEVFRNYVRTVSPPREIPAVVRDGIGFQSIWMAEPMDADPAKAAFRYTDLPLVAKDALQYGIREIVPWAWEPYFELPVRTRPELGTVDDFVRAVRSAREMGVFIAPFVSFQTLLDKYAARYGAKPGIDNETYHSELIPNPNPYYTQASSGTQVNPTNTTWQEDVTATMTEWIDRGVTSFNWDEFNLAVLDGKFSGPVERVTELARARDPEAIVAEEDGNLEIDSRLIDHTWDWMDYEDARLNCAEAAPIINVLRAPRLNCNVEDSPRAVKEGFSDDLYLNLIPKKPDQPNGTALISDVPAMAEALKEVAGLRKQFLPYFTDGVLLGDSMLNAPSTGLVRGYRLGNKLLVIVLNTKDNAQMMQFSSDLGLWLPSTESYRITYYNGHGKRQWVREGTGRDWYMATPQLQPLDMAFYEIEAQ